MITCYCYCHYCHYLMHMLIGETLKLFSIMHCFLGYFALGKRGLEVHNKSVDRIRSGRVNTSPFSFQLAFFQTRGKHKGSFYLLIPFFDPACYPLFARLTIFFQIYKRMENTRSSESFFFTIFYLTFLCQILIDETGSTPIAL